MSLYTISFSDSSDSSDDIASQLPNNNFNKIKSSNNFRRRPLPRCQNIRSVIHTYKVGSEALNNTVNPFQFKASTPSKQNNKKETFTYKNGRRIILPKQPSATPNNNSFNRFKKINPLIQSKITQIKSSSDDESESYYSQYSYYQYESTSQQKSDTHNISPEETNKNNLPIINPQTHTSSQKQIIQDNPTDLDLSNAPAIDINTTHNLDIDTNNCVPMNEDKTLNTEVKNSANEQDQELIQYRIDRKKNGFSIKGKSLKFIFSSKVGDESNPSHESSFIPFIEAFVSGSKISFVEIKTKKVIGLMKAKEKFSHFILSKSDTNKHPIMDIRYQSFHDLKPRSISIHIKDQINNIDSNSQANECEFNNLELRNRVPKRGSFGMWSLDFGKRKIISSIKNSIIVDKNNKEYIIVGKIAENSLSVEAANGMDPICVLGLAVSSFLYSKP